VVLLRVVSILVLGLYLARRAAVPRAEPDAEEAVRLPAPEPSQGPPTGES
jgi:hypothetical protein